MIKSPITLALTDLFLICSPILILACVLFMDGSQDLIFKKPEWSFVSVLLCVEAMRDLGTVAKNKNIDDEQIAAGYSFFSIFLVLTALVLVLDFQHSNGTGHVPTSAVYFVKFAWFIFCALAFLYKRHQRHKILAHPSSGTR